MIPIKDRQKMIKMFHHLDHPGQKETNRRLSKSYYWPGMGKMVNEYVKTCIPCGLAKSSPKIDPGVGDFPVPDERFSFLHMDIVGPLPESYGKRYLLTILDRTSRWAECLPLSQPSSQEVCQQFLEHWVSRFGLPKTVCSDNGNT